MRDPYATLELNPSATPEDIKRAWRRLCRIHHPDRKGGSEQMMAEINLAYNLLMDEEARRRYDRGEGEETPPLDVRAKQCIMQLVFAALTQDDSKTTDMGNGIWASAFETRMTLPVFMETQFVNNIRMYSEKIRKLKAMSDRCKRERKNLLFKEPGNPIEMIFDQVEGQVTEALKTAEQGLETIKRAKEMYAEMIIADSEAKKAAELAKQQAKLSAPQPSLPQSPP